MQIVFSLRSKPFCLSSKIVLWFWCGFPELETWCLLGEATSYYWLWFSLRKTTLWNTDTRTHILNHVSWQCHQDGTKMLPTKGLVMKKPVFTKGARLLFLNDQTIHQKSTFAGSKVHHSQATGVGRSFIHPFLPLVWYLPVVSRRLLSLSTLTSWVASSHRRRPRGLYR